MNALELQLDYPFGDTLVEPGRAREVAPGVYWVRMPLPFALDHINLWLLRDEIDGKQGWTVIDCGIANDTIKAYWEAIFDTQLDALPVLRTLVTHCHPDHLGLADWICRGGARERWNVRLWITLGEYMFGRVMAAGDGSNAGGEAAARHFARHGLADREAIEKLRNRGQRASVARRDGLWSFARALRALQRDGGRADLGRHGVAAHLDERLRF
jgi:glyoxylase-like metal-dependent hydrolase (beta-lactamase superfamily II)